MLITDDSFGMIDGISEGDMLEKSIGTDADDFVRAKGNVIADEHNDAPFGRVEKWELDNQQDSDMTHTESLIESFSLEGTPILIITLLLTIE